MNGSKLHSDRGVQTELSAQEIADLESNFKTLFSTESSTDTSPLVNNHSHNLSLSSIHGEKQPPHYSSALRQSSRSHRVFSMPIHIREPQYSPLAEEMNRSLNLTISDSDTTFDSEGNTSPQAHTSSNLPKKSITSPHRSLQTPSPPSSPESVIIISHVDGGSQLSDAFLRTSSIRKDEESMPKPIPALHGPLSLPYARCPSGAEGTVIEQPDQIPQVIWGLDDEHSAIPKSDCPARQNEHSEILSVKQFNQHPTHTLRASQLSIANEVCSASHPPVAHPLLAAHAPSAKSNLTSWYLPTPVSKYTPRLDSIQPIPTAQSSFHRKNASINPCNQHPHLDHSRQQFPTAPTTIDLQHIQNQILLDQLRSRGRPFEPTTPASALIPTAFLNRNFSPIDLGPPSSPSLLALNQSPPFYNDLGPTEAATVKRNYPLLHQSTNVRSIPSATTAQALPTPPPSTSSLWSSQLTPWSDIVLSPPVPIATIQEPVLSELRQISQTLQPRTVSDPLLYAARKRNPESQESSINTASRIRIASFDGSVKTPGTFLIPSHSSSSSRSTVGTTDPAVSTRGIVANHRMASERSAFVAPPSPMSPNTVNAPTQPRNCKPSLQQPRAPRSVPFARLMQRRLASVPEETLSATESPALGPRHSSFAPASGVGLGFTHADDTPTVRASAFLLAEDPSSRDIIVEMTASPPLPIQPRGPSASDARGFTGRKWVPPCAASEDQTARSHILPNVKSSESCVTYRKGLLETLATPLKQDSALKGSVKGADRSVAASKKMRMPMAGEISSKENKSTQSSRGKGRRRRAGPQRAVKEAESK